MSWKPLNIEAKTKKRLELIKKARDFGGLSKTIDYLLAVHDATPYDKLHKIAEGLKNAEH